MKQSLLATLNQEQQNAVITDSQHTLVLAGAGSGKTRVLVHRIAWLCLEKQYMPTSIFAVTFTNKAAAEMQERINSLIGEAYLNGMWVGTFHGLAHRLLRIFAKQANLPTNFQLIDSDDQNRLIKRIFKERKIDEKQWSSKECSAFISTQKENGIRAKDIVLDNPKSVMWQKVYYDYQAICDRVGYVDFSEIILRTYELLLRNQDVLAYCHQRFSNILVDEFQDTNYIQYELIKMLAGNVANIMIVGDDDQSIYSWRGANADNLQLFINDHPDTEIIRLEQNYRSTGNILNVANALIAHNRNRLGKNLWTKSEQGEKIAVYVAFNDIDEARFVIGKIKKLREQGNHYHDCAILYRNNIQSRLIEDTLLQSAIPYQIYGSIRFYERQEVKLALAYLRLLHDHHNDNAFELVINTPTRGIGEVTLGKLRQNARTQNISLWQSALHMITTKSLSARLCSGLARFIELIESIYHDVEAQPFYQQLERIIKLSGVYEMYEQEAGIKGQSRIENLDELVSAAEQFYQSYSKDKNPVVNELIELDESSILNVLESFLAYTSLEGKESKEQTDNVQLMTLHSAKGLEFEHVFIIGLEEGLFPAQRSITDANRLEEERRLAYVGITRARVSLTLTLCELRRLYGKEERNIASRFLTELPESLLCDLSYRRDVNLTQSGSHNFPLVDDNDADKAFFDHRKASYIKNKNENNGYTLGQKVIHKRFGEGTIINLDGEGDHRRAQIAFVNEGIKWLVIKLANLTLI